MDTKKVRQREEIIKIFKDGMTIAIGGQATMGNPYDLIECLIESGAKHITTISIDSGDPDYSIGRLVHERVVDKMLVTHTGMNPEAMKQIDEGLIIAEYNPIGTLVERIRCGGAGLGGVLTKTGLGTMVQEGKQIVTVNGEDYLLETALRADVALVNAYKADYYGNLMFYGTDMNTNPIVATCADLTIAEAEQIVECTELPMTEIMLPGAYVDIIMKSTMNKRFKNI